MALLCCGCKGSAQARVAAQRTLKGVQYISLRLMSSRARGLGPCAVLFVTQGRAALLTPTRQGAAAGAQRSSAGGHADHMRSAALHTFM